MENRRKMRLLLGAGIVLAGAVVAIALASNNSGGGDLDGDWVVELIEVDGTETPVLAGRTPTANFAEGEVHGSGGCNTFTGGYEIDGDSLTVGPLASTRMFCADPAGAMDQEIAVLSLLGAAETFNVDGDELVIHSGDGRRIVFARN